MRISTVLVGAPKSLHLDKLGRTDRHSPTIILIVRAKVHYLGLTFMNIVDIKNYFSDLPSRSREAWLDAASAKKRFGYIFFQRLQEQLIQWQDVRFGMPGVGFYSPHRLNMNEFESIHDTSRLVI